MIKSFDCKTVEECDYKIKDFTHLMKRGQVDELTGGHYIDMLLERRFEIMKGGAKKRGSAALAGQSTR